MFDDNETLRAGDKRRVKTLHTKLTKSRSVVKEALRVAYNKANLSGVTFSPDAAQRLLIGEQVQFTYKGYTTFAGRKYTIVPNGKVADHRPDEMMRGVDNDGRTPVILGGNKSIPTSRIIQRMNDKDVLSSATKSADFSEARKSVQGYTKARRPKNTYNGWKQR
jgi:hypothetical protein